MHVLCLVSQKGGVGKTTLSGHLAVQAQTAGVGSVALMDTDPQGSLSAWWNVREAETPAFVQTTLESLPDRIAALVEANFNLLIIDTPPAITENIRSVIQVSDLVLVPTRPGPHDLRSVGSTVDLVEDAGKPIVFVINGATRRARITGEAAIALSQHGTVAPTVIHQRVGFAVSMINGHTVMEMEPKSTSAHEVQDLWQYVDAQMRKCERRKHAQNPIVGGGPHHAQR